MQFENNSAKVLRLTIGLWIGYAFAIAMMTLWIMPPARVLWPVFVVSVVVPVALFGAVSSERVHKRFGAALVPSIIVSMVLLTMLLNVLIPPRLFNPPNPITSAEGRTLRSMPIFFMALVLTAWRYSWRHVLWFSLGSGGVSLALVLLQPDFDPRSVIAGLQALFVQTISFLVVGTFISLLMGDLRREHASLEAANAQMRHHAATLENLTISRERNRMARELHDTVAHTLSGLAVQLETIKAYVPSHPATATQLLDQSLQATRTGLNDTRQALRALRASPLEDLGLVLAIQRLAESSAERGQLQLSLALPAPKTLTLASDVEQGLYRIAQEAITNCVNHAGATQLHVTLQVHEGEVRLTIDDNGRGFDVQRLPPVSGHFGLQGMRERAALAGGRFTVHSTPGQGTHVGVTVPLS